MALDRKLVSGNMGAGSGAPRVYTVGTSDTKAAVIADSYFDEIAEILSVGDSIYATTTTTPVSLYVVSITAGVVVTGFVAVA